MTGTPTLGLIGRYELLSRLAVGGMGEVFLARARGAGGFEKEVVIKRMLPHLGSDPGFVQRFIEEGKLVVRLRHANIAQVLDMGEDGGVFFIAMEHVEGKDLSELLRLSNLVGMRMPVPLVVRVLSELLEALDYAHHATDADGRPLGIIHRDVSPSNVLVSTTGEVKLVDFGIARATERLQASTTGVIRGKYGYMSPQQAAGAELDARSDLFSVGVVAWELLTGTRPFDGASDLLTLDRVRFTDPGPITAVAPDVPTDLGAWVARLLAKQPDQRFDSADSALAELRVHVLKSGTMASARDLAAWVQSVVSALPAGLDTPGAAGALSLDDLLKLGLHGGLRGPGTVEAPAHPGSRTPSGRPLPTPSPSRTPLGLAAPPDIDPVVTPVPRRRTFPLVTLVVLNLVLIAVVLVLVLRPGATEVAESLDATTAATAPADAFVVAASPDTAAPDIRPEATVAATHDTSPPAPTPVVAGSAFGAALGEAAASALADDIELTIRVSPADASLSIAGLGTSRGSRKLAVRRGTLLSLRVTAPDHQPASRSVIAGDGPTTIQLALEPTPRGIVKFRYFPANATILLDGRALPAGSNTRELSLPVGAHVIEVVAGDTRKSWPFQIEADKTTSLGVLEP